MSILSLEKLKNTKLADLIKPNIVRFIWTAILDEKVCDLCRSHTFSSKIAVQINLTIFGFIKSANFVFFNFSKDKISIIYFLLLYRNVLYLKKASPLFQ